MAYFEWSESLSIGHQEIDSQHQGFIDIINQLHDTLIQDHGDDLHTITGKSLESMSAYVSKHFAFEETQMLNSGYPGYDNHKKIHDEFKVRVSRLLEEHKEQGVIVLNSQIMKILKNWLQQHIMQEDQKLADFISGSQG